MQSWLGLSMLEAHSSGGPCGEFPCNLTFFTCSQWRYGFLDKLKTMGPEFRLQNTFRVPFGEHIFWLLSNPSPQPVASKSSPKAIGKIQLLRVGRRSIFCIRNWSPIIFSLFRSRGFYSLKNNLSVYEFPIFLSELTIHSRWPTGTQNGGISY